MRTIIAAALFAVAAPAFAGSDAYLTLSTWDGSRPLTTAEKRESCASLSRHRRYPMMNGGNAAYWCSQQDAATQRRWGAIQYSGDCRTINPGDPFPNVECKPVRR